VLEFSVIVSNRNLRQGGIPEDRLLGGTPEAGASHFVDVGVRDYYTYLRSLCDRMRESFDYIVFDTRGGFDITSVVPAIVSDIYCIVLEADEISVQQVFGLKSKVDEYSRLLECESKLKGFIVNKALYSPADKSFVSTVAGIYGGQPLGTVPADRLAIRAYQRKDLALETAPEGDFAYYAFQVIDNIVGSDKASWSETECLSFTDLGAKIGRKWRSRTRLELLEAINPYVALTLLTLAGMSYFVASRSLTQWSILLFYVVGGITTSWLAVLASITLFARWRQDDRFRVSRWVTVPAMFVLCGGLGYLALFDVPRRLSQDALFETIKRQSERVADQDMQLRATRSDLDAVRAKLIAVTVERGRKRAVLVEKRWESYQEVGCDALNERTLVASVPLDHNYEEQVLSVRATLENVANLTAKSVNVVGSSDNEATIAVRLAGLKRELLSNCGSGHANVVVSFNVLRQQPEVSAK
jgi:hypothetical protein